MTNLIERLKHLEARIYAADGHEGHKYDAQFTYELEKAWPLLGGVVAAATEEFQHPRCGQTKRIQYPKTTKALDALAALDEESQ